MLDAISYATGVSKDHMTVLWLGNNGSPQDAKGKVLDKTNGKSIRSPSLGKTKRLEADKSRNKITAKSS